MSDNPRIINISFTKNETELLKILDELVKYDMATNRSAWFKDQIRNRFYEMRKDGIMVASDEE
jgi:metal-responsive CopG/Arc/MetJ family transcriptional regulator